MYIYKQQYHSHRECPLLEHDDDKEIRSFFFGEEKKHQTKRRERTTRIEIHLMYLYTHEKNREDEI